MKEMFSGEGNDPSWLTAHLATSHFCPYFERNGKVHPYNDDRWFLSVKEISYFLDDAHERQITTNLQNQLSWKQQLLNLLFRTLTQPSFQGSLYNRSDEP